MAQKVPFSYPTAPTSITWPNTALPPVQNHTKTNHKTVRRLTLSSSCSLSFALLAEEMRRFSIQIYLETTNACSAVCCACAPCACDARHLTVDCPCRAQCQQLHRPRRLAVVR